MLIIDDFEKREQIGGRWGDSHATDIYYYLIML